MGKRKSYTLQRLIAVCLLLCAGSMSWAQAPVYTCDFEDEAERAQWTLNPVSKQSFLDAMPNRWRIGEPGDFSPTGTNGLYISPADRTDSALYSVSQAMFTFAVREMPALPEGKYNLYFDWKCKGKADLLEGLYVCWVPESVKINGATGVKIPNWALQNRIGLPEMPDSVYARKSMWGPGKAIIDHDGTPHKLVFVWFNVKGGNPYPPSACVDNIELRPQLSTPCAPPTNVTHSMTGDSVILKWEGNADHYSVKYYDYTANKWYVNDTIINNSFQNACCTIPNVSEGAQSFFLRAYCDNETASDFVEYTEYIAHKGIYCIDYMELTKNNCFTGTYTNQFSKREKVDMGYYNWNSRHTLHYIPDEYDEHTNYELRTCPKGYRVSVRLGDNTTGGLGEGIRYTYKVASGETAILKIKYAMVLENPENHDSDEMPKFCLDILCNGSQIPNECGYALFQANEGGSTAGWKEGAKGWVYKDWEEHAVNLREYVGETLTIQISTADCTLTGHTGYAYFVLDCESGTLSSLNCGEDNPTTVLTAPGGFNYAWYVDSAPDKILSTEQTFTIGPMDPTLYSVNVINKKNENCYYTLSASGMPRIPKPLFTHVVKEIRCENIVTFTNSSCVYRQNMQTGKIAPSDEPVTFLEWDFGDGEVIHSLDSVVRHAYPKEGGHFVMHLRAGISDNACIKDTSIVLDLPDLSSPTTEMEKHLCRDDYPWGFEYEGKRYLEDVDSVFTLISKQTGCDSLCHVRLKFHEKGPFVHTDTICYGDSLLFTDRWLKATGCYDTLLHNPWGCDSLVRLDLFVDPLLQIKMPDTLHICPEDNVFSIPYIVEQGRLDSLIIRFDSLALEAGFDSVYAFGADEEMVIPVSDSLTPNRYWATLSYRTPLCEATTHPLCVEVGYSASVIWQKTDLLAITNEDYNGGYTFLTYQWYRDGQPIEGATGPNLSVTDADRGHEFYVVLQRQGDGVKLGTCSVVYIGTTGISNINIGTLQSPIDVYSVMGVRVVQIESVAEMNNLPSGIYILTDGDTTLKWVR